MKPLSWLATAALSSALFLALGAVHAPPADAAPAAVDVPAPQPMQAQCGDGRCEPPEDCSSCSSDCGECCGDGHCAYGEDCRSCSRDCGDCCGNGRCAPPEDCRSCPSDCGGC